MILPLPIEVDIVMGEKSLGCISMISMFPHKDIGEGFEKRFNIMFNARTRVLNTGSDPRRVWQTQISLTLYV